MKIKFTLTVSKIYDLDEIFSGQQASGQDASAVNRWVEDSISGILDDPIAFVDQLGVTEKVTHEEV